MVNLIRTHFAILLIATVTSAAVVKADIPSQEPEALSVAFRAMEDLDRLRVLGVSDPRRIKDTLVEGLAAVNSARKQYSPAIPSTSPAVGKSKDSKAIDQIAADTRAKLCQVSFVEAELNRRAAAALPNEHSDRNALFAAAIAQFQSLRIEYRDLAGGYLGFIGEARVYCLQGDYKKAVSTLSPVLIALEDRKLDSLTTRAAQIQRVLWNERLSIELNEDLQKGIVLSTQLAASELGREASPEEVAAFRWIVAKHKFRAAAESAASEPAELASELRSSDVVAVAPNTERLSLLVALHEKCRIELTAAELLSWARLGAWGGTNAARTYYALAAETGPELFSFDDWMNCGKGLLGARQYPEAAAAFESAASKAVNDEQRTIAIANQRHAQLVRVERSSNATERLASAEDLWKAIEATSQTPARLPLLKQWMYLQTQLGTLAEQKERLRPFQDDIDSDDYLTLLQATCEWQVAAESQRKSIAAQLMPRIQRVLSHEFNESHESAAVLMAEMSAVASRDPRAGVKVLEEYELAFGKEHPLSTAARNAILTLLLSSRDGNLVEHFISQNPSLTLTPENKVNLAHLTALGFSSLTADSKAETKKNVVSLVRSIPLVTVETNRREAILSIAAESLALVAAYDELERLLSSVPKESLNNRCGLLLADAYLKQNSLAKASQLAEELQKRFPADPQIMLSNARAMQANTQWTEAASAYRQTRKSLDEGSSDWWMATIGLAESLRGEGHQAAGKEILRVANAMYRTSMPAELSSRIDTLLSAAD